MSLLCLLLPLRKIILAIMTLAESLLVVLFNESKLWPKKGVQNKETVKIILKQQGINLEHF